MSLYSASGESITVNASMTTLLEVNPPANRVATITEASVTFSGVSSSDVPVLVELCEVTAASGAGTAVTPASMKDGQVTVGAAAKKALGSEGTVTVLKAYMVPPSTGLVIQYPLGREPQIQGAGASAKGFSIRANRGSGAAITADANIEWEE